MEHKPKILVVDDEKHNLIMMEAMLIPQGYEVLLARDGIEALEMAHTNLPDVILLDVMIPKMDGFEVARRLRSDTTTEFIPIVMVTALCEVDDRVRALEIGADDFLTKPVDKTELRARVKSLVKVKAYNDCMKNYQKELEEEVARQTEQLREAFQQIKVASLDTILRLSRAAEYKDEDTGAHIQRVSLYASAVARELGHDDEMIDNILYAAPMHDVGKLGIPDHILLKPGKLEPEEWVLMRQHTTIGAAILAGSSSNIVQIARIIALSHHEKWDGSGYPQGLSGTMIPIVGQITAIADVFDALTSKRTYKEASTIEESFTVIQENSGKHFDPVVVDAFLAIETEIRTIFTQHHDEGESLFRRIIGIAK